MKKILTVVLTAMLMLLACACTNGTAEDASSQAEKSVQPSKQEESSEEEKPRYDKLQNTFGRLWSGEYYYIDVRMIVESDQALISAEGGSEPEGDPSEYTYQIAVDQASDRAMLVMNMPDGTTGHLIINDHKCYKLDDQNKTYSEQEFPYNAKRFGEMYTTDIYLGMMNYLTPEGSGRKSFKASENDSPIELDYEQYRLTPDSDASDAVTEAHVTYYFRGDVPYAEVLETDKGRTTFVFNSITDKPGDGSIFELPTDYVQESSQG